MATKLLRVRGQFRRRVVQDGPPRLEVQSFLSGYKWKRATAMKHAPALVQLHSMASRKSHQTTASKSSLCKEDQWALAVVDRSNPPLWSQRLTESGPTRVRPAVGNCRAPGNHVGSLKLGKPLSMKLGPIHWKRWKFESRVEVVVSHQVFVWPESRRGGQRGGSGRSRSVAIWRASFHQTRPAGSSPSTIPMKWRPRRNSKTVSRASDPENVIADRPVAAAVPGPRHERQRCRPPRRMAQSEPVNHKRCPTLRLQWFRSLRHAICPSKPHFSLSTAGTPL